MAATGDIRNVILLGHGGSGKTSITEAILHTTGAISRLGSVDEKTTVSDYYDEEKEHQHSILASVVNAQYNGKLINVIDAPGSPDFIGPAIAAMPAAETAIVVVNATSGIETNTRKLFALAGEMGKPRVIVINKIAAENVELPELLKSIQDTFGSQCRLRNLPSADKKSIIDCIENAGGDSPVMSVADAHTQLIENVVEADDALMERYLGGEEIPAAEIAGAFVKALRTGTLIPIVFTEARQEVGIKELLSLITKYTPSPADAEPAKLVDGEKVTEVEGRSRRTAGGRGLPRRVRSAVEHEVFDDPHLQRHAQVRYEHDAQRREEGSAARAHLQASGRRNEGNRRRHRRRHRYAGQARRTQDRRPLHDGRIAGKYQMPAFPEPMFSLAMEPASRGDEQKIGGALDRLREEDPCFKTTRDAQTKELVVHGLGDLHLRIMIEKMANRFKLAVNTKEPKIPYKETITAKAEGHYRHKKQTGGSGQFGEVYLKVEPAERNSNPPLQFSWDIFGGSIPGQYEPAVLKGVNDVMVNGPVAGFPMQDVKVSITDGKYHPVDSKEIAFRTAGKGAFIDAIKKAKPALLEPIVNMEVTIPAENVGDIAGDLSSKRGRVIGQDMLPGNFIVIKAQAPLSEVSQYSSQLKSVTGGRGSFSMTLSHYEPVPPNVQQQVVAMYGKKKDDMEE